jgi:uncharacterized LabA/DUF88 family protein
MRFSEFSDLKKVYPSEKVQVFIDGANLYWVLENECGRHDLDFRKFGLKLAAGRKLVRVNYYISTLNPEKEPEKARGQQQFLRAMEATPYITVKTRPLHYFEAAPQSRKGEKGIDILIASDMLSQAYNNGYDTAILVSGDGDFTPLLDEVKKLGKEVENAFPRSGRSEALINSSDVYIELDQNFFGDCFIQKTGSTGNP